LNTKPQRC